VGASRYHEGFVSLLDAPTAAAQRIRFDAFERGNALAAELAGHDGVRRIQAFSAGLWAMGEEAGPRRGRVHITDLRMGQEPTYAFSFVVAERHSPPVPVMPAEAVGRRPDIDRALPWLWQRLQGDPVLPPR